MQAHVRRSFFAISGLTFALCTVYTLAAQEPTLRAGARVRVTFSDTAGRPIAGIVHSVGDDSLRLRTNSAVPSAISFSRIEHLEVWRGRYRPTWSKTAPLWLTALAAGTGAIICNNESQDPSIAPDEPALCAIGCGILALPVGIGLAIFVKKDRWETVRTPGNETGAPPAPSLYVSPRSRGLQIGLQATF